jgi:hypothetical protein
MFEEIGDPAGRRDEDFYATPAWQTRALLRRQPVATFGRIVEPCVGDGAILRELGGGDVLTNDLVARDPILPEFLLDARQPSTWDAFACTGRIDTVITNVPFKDAFEIAQVAWERAAFGLILLLRLSWLEPVDDPPRGAWLAAYPPTRCIVMPRWSYRNNGETDSVTSAWFLWAKVPGFFMPGFDFVTTVERDQLIAEIAREERR